MKTSMLSALLLSAVLAGCNNDPTKDKPKAVTGEAVATSTMAAPGAMAPGTMAPGAMANATTYTFDNTNSKVGFVGAKVTGKHEGSFGAFKGTVKIPGTDADKGSVKVDIETASVTTDADKLTGHLKTAEFFDVEKFPKATFESTKIVKGGEGGATHTITGNLTLHGVTKSITFPAKVNVAGDSVSVDADFGINRKDFGIAYPGKADDLIKDEVLLKLAIKSKKA